METPKFMFSFYFLFLLLVVISFGYLAIYTNEHLLLLNNVDRQNECYFLKNKIFEVSGGGFGAILVLKTKFYPYRQNKTLLITIKPLVFLPIMW